MFLGETGTSVGCLKVASVSDAVVAVADMSVVAEVVDLAAVGSAGSVEVDHIAAVQVEDSVASVDDRPAVDRPAVDCPAVAALAVEGLAVEDPAVEDLAVEDLAVEDLAVEDPVVEGLVAGGA